MIDAGGVLARRGTQRKETLLDALEFAWFEGGLAQRRLECRLCAVECNERRVNSFHDGIDQRRRLRAPAIETAHHAGETRDG